MKYLLTLFSLILFNALGQGQNLSVKSFKALETDMDAKVHFPIKDLNNRVCALIKIVNPNKGFAFDNGTLGIVKTSDKIGETWVYVPRGTKKLTIAHSKLGVLRDYIFDIPIEEAKCYELVLLSGSIETKIIEEQETGFLEIKTTIQGSDILIDNKEIGKQTPLINYILETGKHDIKITNKYYAEYVAQVNIENSKLTTINYKPENKFKLIKINSSPEQGADIFIDDVNIKEKIPFTQMLTEGKHNIKLKKEWYESTSQQINIILNDTGKTSEKGKTQTMDIKMPSLFGTLNIYTTPGADIYINKTYIDTSTVFNHRLNPNIHFIEIKKDKYNSLTKNINIKTNQNDTLSLMLSPIEGKLTVMTNPSAGDIFIDGKKIDAQSPTNKKIIIGEHSIKISKPGGFDDIVKTINITPDNNVTINEKFIKQTSAPTSEPTEKETNEKAEQLQQQSESRSQNANTKQSGKRNKQFGLGYMLATPFKGLSFKVGSPKFLGQLILGNYKLSNKLGEYRYGDLNLIIKPWSTKRTIVDPYIAVSLGHTQPKRNPRR